MYDHSKIDKKWQKYWEENKVNKTENDYWKAKFYALDMFPYPSGAGLHVGHPKWYLGNDILARLKKLQWYNVLHPMWWDAFGLPAENYAIKTGIHPRKITDENIQRYKEQISQLWISYDWDREIDTTDPKYYKWTQWIFLKMFENGLAYEQDLPINYCPHCKTWLANEEVLNDWTHERCGNSVEKKKLRQWVLAITKYADRLSDDVDKLDWPDSIKQMQKNWIWRSEGCEFEMNVVNDDYKSLGNISVYTTRIDTVFGMTYAVVAPDHPEVHKFIDENQKQNCEKYINDSTNKADLDRTEAKEKTWVFTWNYVINPFNNERVPLWIWDYVLWNYGTGAVMAVPAHDERDFEFAKKYELWISYVINNKESNISYDSAYAQDWILMNSWDFDWFTSKEAREKLTDYAEKEWFGHKKVNYKLRDWLFSRQRYWWEPIPLIHLSKEDVKSLDRIRDLSEAEDNKAYVLKKPAWENSDPRNLCSNWEEKYLVINKEIYSPIYSWLYSDIVCDYNLPLELPQVERYEPSDDGRSPLANVEEFLNVKLAENLEWERETNTMPQWWWSCWYYLRYMDPDNNENLASKEALDYWNQVDSYVGGVEHAVLHLLYARFWHKFLYDINVVNYDEPFKKLVNQWLVQAYAYQRSNWWLVAVDEVDEKDWKYFHKETWEEVQKVISKMSKSLKNVENPDDVIAEYWADTFRLYEMYMWDFRDAAPWDTKGIVGCKRFLDKIYKIVENWNSKTDTKWEASDEEKMIELNKTIKKVWEDIQSYKFNTAIAQMMILANTWCPNDESLVKEWIEKFLIILAPFAPHTSEELWEKIWNKPSIFQNSTWPEYDPWKLENDTITLAVQVNWKLRSTIDISKDANEEEFLDMIQEDKKIMWYISDWYKKLIYIPGKIANFIV